MRAMKWWTGMLCMLAFLGLTSTASAVKIQKDLPAGVTLTPEERAHGEAVVVTGADERSTAVQVGTGANAALVKTSVPTGTTQRGESIVVPLNGHAVGNRPDLLAAPAKGLRRARAAVGLSSWGNQYDKQCSIYGCWFWANNLRSHAYFDSTGWVWMFHTRYGLTGDMGCSGGSSIFYSSSRVECGSHYDPAYYGQFFTSSTRNISGCYKFCSNVERWIHRHIKRLSTWAVFGGS